jgi:hypothetical protein
MKRQKDFILVAIFALLAVVNVGGQSLNRGQIRGTVTDAQGAVVPAVEVLVTSTETNLVTTLTTNQSGFYLATELVPGTYTVQFRAQGFEKLDISNVVVKSGSTITEDGVMRLGQLTETVNVSSAPPVVETTASNFTTSISTQIIDKVPIVGRDIQTLVQLMPGITQSVGPTGASFGFDSEFGGFPDPTHIVGSGISANGSQGGANAWYLDGTLNATLGPESVVVNPSPDAVSEFNLVNNGLSAQWSRTSGAVVNIVLKSGTNAFHGDVYDYSRNSFFSASNPFSRRDPQGGFLSSPRVNYNDFGGTLGGPIIKNRTFFFFSWETSLLHENKNKLYTVPTALEKTGNFSDRPDLGTCPTCLIYDPYSTVGPDASGLFHRTPLPGNIIPPSRQDPLAMFYINSFPNPNFVDPLQQGGSGCGVFCNNFLGPIGSSLTTNNMSIKVDHRISEKSALFAEYLFNPSYYANFRLPWIGPTAPTQGFSGAQPYTTANQIFTLGHTQTFTPTLINEFRASYSRQNQIPKQNPNNLVNNAAIEQRIQGLNFILDRFGPVPTIGVDGFAGFGPQQWQNGLQGVDAYTLQDDVTKIIGNHTVKAGLMWRRDDNWYNASWGYNLGFGSSLTNDPVTGLGGNGLATFMLGAVSYGNTGTFHYPYQTNDYWGFYVQDDYRITPKFTLNIGLRYDIFGWFRERHDYLANFNFSAMNPDVPYKGRIDYFGTPAHPDSNVFPANKGDLGPRINFAWTPTNDRKVVIRGGYDLIYSNGISAAFGDQNGGISGPAYANQFNYNGDFTGQRPVFQLSKGAPNLNLPPLNQVKQTNNQFLGTGVQGFLKGSKDPYVQQWSLFVERELPSNMSISVGYVGTHGLHLYGDEFRGYDHVPTVVRQKLRNSINDTVATPAPLVPIYGSTMPLSLLDRPYPQYTGIGINSNPDGFNRYHSFQTRFQKRYSNGLNFIAAYTHQKNIGTPNTGSIIGNTATPTTIGRTVGRASGVAGALSGGSGNTAGGSSSQDPDNRFADVALTADDIPNVLNLAATYELPFGRGKTFLSGGGFATAIFGGWSLTQNWNFQNGVPLVISGPCNALTCRPNFIGDPNSGPGVHTQNQWFNPNAFEAVFQTNPAVLNAPDPSIYNEWWQFGNMGLRNGAVRSPGFWNVDASLSKDFHITEQKYISLRWDVFNALNHQNLGIPNTNWCLGPNPDGSDDLVHQFGCQFGKITGVQTDPRAMQFALKFYF